MLGSVAPTPLSEAIIAARSRLGHARGLLIRQELPPLGHLIVRHRMSVPGGSEALWAIVSSWSDLHAIRGRSLNDGNHSALAHIRMGSPVLIPAAAVIDWAVIGDNGQIEEGGWTRGLDASMTPVPR